MATIVFWGKPGCLTNGEQQKLLRAAGHALEVRDLLTEAWTPAWLASFLDTRSPVASWFNSSAPKIKSGEVDPTTFSAEQALARLCAEPLLIRRPLLEIDGALRLQGFDAARLQTWLPQAKSLPDGCSSATMEPCPTPSAEEGFT